MPIYRVTRKSDQAEVYRYASDAAVEWVGMEFATHDHTPVPAEPAPEQPAPDPALWRITRLAFRQRFTAAEKATLTFVARQATQQGAAVQSYLDDVQAAAHIDLLRTDTRAGVQALEAGGLLAAGRAAVILDTPPTAEELYRG